MPLPKPRPNEEQAPFMQRCMHESDLPVENNQRLAACGQAWRDRNKKDNDGSTGASALNFLRPRT